MPTAIQQRRTVAIAQYPIWREPGVKQAAGFQGGFQPGLLRGIQARVEVHQMPERRAVPLQTHTTGPGARLGGQRVFASGQPGAFVLDVGALFVQASEGTVQLRLLSGVSL